MCEDHCRGIVFQGLSHHFSWVDGRAVNGAPEQLTVLDEAMTIVQEQACEHLVGRGAQSAGEEAA